MLDNTLISAWDIINVIMAYIDWIILFFIVHNLGNSKITSLKRFGFSSIILLIVGYMNIIDMIPNIRIAICIVISFIYYKCVYREKIFKCILVIMIFWLSTMLAEAISAVIVLFINDLGSINHLTEGNNCRVQAIIVSKTLIVIEYILFKYFKLYFEVKAKDLLLIGIPIGSNILCLLLIFGYNMRANVDNKENILVVLVATTFLMMSSLAILFIIKKIIDNDKVKLENQLINDRIEIVYKNYDNINETHNRVRNIYHDLKNHMICIASYDSKEEMINYIDSLNLEINEFNDIVNTGNKTLDIILSEKKYECEKYKINFDYSINFSKIDFISDIDVCCIFGNALDNAIEACKFMEEKDNKAIDVKVTYINEFCIIKFINTKRNKITIKGKKIITSKENKTTHGIGLTSIKYAVNKYGGESSFSYSDEEFNLKIMIPLH